MLEVMKARVVRKIERVVIFTANGSSMQITRSHPVWDAAGKRIKFEDVWRVVMSRMTPYITVASQWRSVEEKPVWDGGNEVLPIEFRGPPDRIEREEGEPQPFHLHIGTEGTNVGVVYVNDEVSKLLDG